MNILILDSWLREYVDTKATPEQISKYLSLCGPSVERTEKVGSDYVYDIEVTTNRVDTMSVLGIARELSAVLPTFGIKAKIITPKKELPELPKKGHELKLVIDPKLTSRLMGVVVEDIKTKKTPGWMKKRLEACGHRSLSPAIDVTNYLMHEIGHPCHVFDYDAIASSAYDKIKTKKIVVRESKKGEKITSFDNKTYTLTGGDIVFDDGKGNIIDLPGVIGTKNSVVGKNTKRVLFFFDTNEPSHIRHTSMSQAIRTVAATLNEKGVDPELADISMARGLDLFVNTFKAKIASPIYNSYPKPFRSKTVSTDRDFICSVLGVEVGKTEITNILKALEFEPKWKGEKLSVSVPSFRAEDINMPIDIAEEVARIYGYHNLPSVLMSGELPDNSHTVIFKKEQKIRDSLVKLGGVEVFTYSLVSKGLTGPNSLKLKNPLGADTEYLRDNLLSSLIPVAVENQSLSEKFHIYEIANVYKEKSGDLPEENLMLAGVFSGYEYLEAKGIVESLLGQLNIKFKVKKTSNSEYEESSAISFVSDGKEIINLGEVKNTKFISYEVKMSDLTDVLALYPTYVPIPEHPPQIEDMTIKISDRQVGEVFEKIQNSHKYVSKVELADIYQDNYTFRIWYQHPKKTLTDKEVASIREKIEKKI